MKTRRKISKSYVISIFLIFSIKRFRFRIAYNSNIFILFSSLEFDFLEQSLLEEMRKLYIKEKY